MPITVSGTQITFNDGTNQTTAFTGAAGVTSVATGNGLQGGTITTSGTLSVACPTFGTVGSYTIAIIQRDSGFGPTSGSNYSSGTGVGQVRSAVWGGVGGSPAVLSGTWKWMAASASADGYNASSGGMICRVA